MTVRQDMKEKRAAHSDPINFTCGGCGKVNAFKGSYECDACGYGKDSVKGE